MKGRPNPLVERAIEEYGSKPKQPFTFIYFIQALEGGPIKIGRGDPVLRLKGIQCGNPLRLGLTRVVVDHCSEEGRLHALFAELRMCGEWFQPHPVVATLADAIPDESLAHHDPERRLSVEPDGRVPNHFDAVRGVDTM